MSMFTRRHYVWLASVARDLACAAASTHDTHSHVANAIQDLAYALEDEARGANGGPSSFDRPRFLHAVFCDPTSSPDHRCPYSRNLAPETLAR